MVLRYWGDRQVQPQDFAADRLPGGGGISAEVLVRAVRERGFRAWGFDGDPDLVRHHLEAGRPVIVLLEVAPGRRHYVVLLAWRGGRVLLHDPAEGPYRTVAERVLEREWERTGRWSLLVLPAGGLPRESPPAARTSGAAETGYRCDPGVDAAVDLARSGRLDRAALELESAAARCPEAARPRRELAAVRFREGRYAEAARLTEDALVRDPGDPDAWRLLGASRFLSEDPAGALAAWNRAGEPKLDRLALSGLERTNRELIAEYLALAPRVVLTSGRYRQAGRRLASLPSVSGARLGLHPLGEGRVQIDAAVLERPILPPLRVFLLRAAVDAAARKQTDLALFSPTRRGEEVAARVRWRSGRPAARLRIAAPGLIGRTGITEVDLGWERQSYLGAGSSAAAVSEERRGGRLSLGDWWTADLHGRLSLGLESWNGDAPRVVTGLSLDQRLLHDHVALRGSARRFWSIGGETSFSAGRVGLAFRSSHRARRLTATARLGLDLASADAPLGLWSGAGTGRGRPALLRGHRLLDGGRLRLEALGRRLLSGGVEARLRCPSLGPTTVAVAGFVDWARAWQGEPGLASFESMDAGGGLRLGLPGRRGTLRLDLGRPVGGGTWHLSAGWQTAWPAR